MHTQGIIILNRTNKDGCNFTRVTNAKKIWEYLNYRKKHKNFVYIWMCCIIDPGFTIWTTMVSAYRAYFAFLTMAQQPLVDQGPLIIENSWSHSDTPQAIELLWTSDQPDAGTSTCQHTTLTRDKLPCSRRDSNPHSQQARGWRPTS